MILIRTEESKRQWILAEIDNMDYPEYADNHWDDWDDWDVWTQEDEAALEDWEDDRRRKLAEANEF